MTLRCSTNSCARERWRDGSPPSSAARCSTGWPLRPPWSLIHRTQMRTPSDCGFRLAPAGPDSEPTVPMRTGALVSPDALADVVPPDDAEVDPPPAGPAVAPPLVAP